MENFTKTYGKFYEFFGKLKKISENFTKIYGKFIGLRKILRKVWGKLWIIVGKFIENLWKNGKFMENF